MLSTAREPLQAADASHAVRASVPLEEAVRSWLADLRLANRSQSTVNWYRNVFEQRLLPILRELGVRTVDQLERDHVRRLREALQAQGKVYHGFQRPGVPARSAALSPATLHADHRTIRAFYRWCVFEGYSANRAATRLRIPKEPSREPRVFSERELEAKAPQAPADSRSKTNGGPGVMGPQMSSRKCPTSETGAATPSTHSGMLPGRRSRHRRNLGMNPDFPWTYGT